MAEAPRMQPDQKSGLSYTIDETLVRIVATGTPTPHAFDRLLHRIASDPRHRRGMPIFHDRRGATTPTTKDAHQFAQIMREHAHRFGPCRWAVVVGNHDRGLAYGMSRMISALHDDTPLTSCPFRNVDDALEWLGVR